MEKQNQNLKKNSNKHLIISLSIIGVALLAALVIAIVAIVGQFGNKINGKNTTELYNSLESTVLGQNSYRYVITKTGSGRVTDSNGVAKEDVISLTEEITVNGKDFYHQRTSTLNGVTFTQKTTFVDGVLYIYTVTGGGNPQKIKLETATTDYLKSISVLKTLILNYEDLFTKSDVSKNGDEYIVKMNKDLALDDPKFTSALRENAIAFYDENATKFYDEEENESNLFSGFLDILSDFEEYDYSITYDGQGRPVSVAYGYLMGYGNFFVGDIFVTAGFEYENIDIKEPSDASSYMWSVEKK